MSKIKVGVIGVGSISQFHIKAYLNNPDVELYAFCDINEAQLKKRGEEFGVTRLYNNADDLLKLDEIDAVSVCVWNSAHAEVTIKALNAGKHVLCEKPMALTAAQAEEMKAAADKNGKLLMLGFVCRYDNSTKVMKELIEKGELGEIYYTKAKYVRRDGNPGGWFGDKSRSGGGPLIDLGVHNIDLLRYLVGKPKPVSVYGVTFQKLYDRKNIRFSQKYTSVSHTKDDICTVEDLASAFIRYDNGVVTHVEVSFALNTDGDTFSNELFGTKAGLKQGDDLTLYTELNDCLADVKLKGNMYLDDESMFREELDHFVDCIINGTECISPAQDGVDMMKILNAIYESAETGHEVIL